MLGLFDCLQVNPASSITGAILNSVIYGLVINQKCTSLSDADQQCAASDVARAGSSMRLFYNNLWGPLRAGSSLTVKAGFNGWDDIVEEPMRCDPASLLGSPSLQDPHILALIVVVDPR